MTLVGVQRKELEVSYAEVVREPSYVELMRPVPGRIHKHTRVQRKGNWRMVCSPEELARAEQKDSKDGRVKSGRVEPIGRKYSVEEARKRAIYL